jgi:hypothetical protein
MNSSILVAEHVKGSVGNAEHRGGQMVIPTRHRTYVVTLLVAAILVLALFAVRVTQARPATVTLVPGHPVQVTILSYRGAGAVDILRHGVSQQSPTKRRSISNRATVRTLTRLANSVLPIPRNAVTSCPTSSPPPRADVLWFRYSDGHRSKLYLNFEGCATAWSASGKGWLLGEEPPPQDVWDYDQHLVP